jgi:hypothetical protein
MPRQPDTDPEIISTRGQLGVALKMLDADAAADAARALVQAKKNARIRRAREVLAEAGIKVDVS